MSFDIVTVTIPAAAGHMAILRTAVGGFAARDSFTLDQVDDLRMAVEEAAVQLLRRTSGDRIGMDLETTDLGVEVRLHAEVAGDAPVIDETSFSWTILRALADDLRLEKLRQQATVVLTKHRLAVSTPQDGR